MRPCSGYYGLCGRPNEDRCEVPSLLFLCWFNPPDSASPHQDHCCFQINSIYVPLIKIKGDVELIENEINSGLDKVRNLLIKKRNILEKKLILKHLLGLQENLIYLERNDMTSLRKSFSLLKLFLHLGF